MFTIIIIVIVLQVKLGNREQKDIINELRTTQNIRDCLDDVEIIIGFLSSGGGDANIELRKYVKRALKIEDRFKSKKVSCYLNLCVCICVDDLEFFNKCTQALEYCHLGHILSLWETLSVQMSKNLTLAQQVRVDHIYIQSSNTKEYGKIFND